MEEVLNVKELTQYLRCSDSTVRKLIKNKEIPNFRIANRIYFKKALIDMWIQNQCMRSVEVMKSREKRMYHISQTEYIYFPLRVHHKTYLQYTSDNRKKQHLLVHSR